MKMSNPANKKIVEGMETRKFQGGIVMIINHNMKAMNAHRMMGINASTMGKSTEKLSSGLRVNRAADDAAGLSISEKMRGQIRGLMQASRNAQDGISVVQTAEGALDEAHSILQRMRQLAVQSANDSNVAIDRAAIQQEVTQLTDELDRIAGTTEFNTKKLLDGTFKDNVFHVGANQDQNIKVTIKEMSAKGLGVRKTEDVSAAAANINELGKSISSLGNSISSLTKQATTLASAAASIKTGSLKELNSILTSAKTNGGVADGSITSIMNSIANHEASIANLQSSVITREDSVKRAKGEIAKKEEEKIALQGIVDARGGVYVGTQERANTAITTINDAITKVSTQRSQLGAVQNRMEHTIRNLDNAAENTQAAESRIRDVDMALEMSEFTKKNILTQASQAMLAQANQLPQQVLQLLR